MYDKINWFPNVSSAFNLCEKNIDEHDEVQPENLRNFYLEIGIFENCKQF